jgi:hypothetical protein
MYLRKNNLTGNYKHLNTVLAASVTPRYLPLGITDQITLKVVYIASIFVAYCMNTGTLIIIIITMARQPYMSLGLLFPKLLGLVYFVAVSDRLTGRHTYYTW